jgi:hypothetical protein
MTVDRCVSDLTPPERARWVVRSGLRLLRLSHPIKSEHDYEDNLWVERELARLLASGALAGGSYNIRKASLLGEDHISSVFLNEQRGQSSKGEMPADVRDLPTIEVPREGRLAEHRLTSIVARAAADLPPKDLVATSTPMKEVLEGLQALRLGQGAASSYFSSVLREAVEQETIALIGRLAVRVFPVETLSQAESALVSKFETDMMVAFARFGVNGYPVSALLFLCALSRAAAPAEPFRHSFTTLSGRSEVAVSDVLGNMLLLPGSMSWLEAAADYLVSMGQIARDQARAASNIDDFYHHQFIALPYFHACAHANTALMALDTGSDAVEKLRAKFNEADEFVARVVAALWHDFQNSIDLAQILANRRTYLQLASERPRFAKQTLQKWLDDDEMFPEFWTPFVTGTAQDLPWENT